MPVVVGCRRWSGEDLACRLQHPLPRSTWPAPCRTPLVPTNASPYFLIAGLEQAAAHIVAGRYIQALQASPALRQLLDCSAAAAPTTGPSGEAPVTDAESYFAVVSARAVAAVEQASASASASAFGSGAEAGAGAAGTRRLHAVLLAGVACLHVFQQHNLTGWVVCVCGGGTGGRRAAGSLGKGGTGCGARDRESGKVCVRTVVSGGLSPLARHFNRASGAESGPLMNSYLNKLLFHPTGPHATPRPRRRRPPRWTCLPRPRPPPPQRRSRSGRPASPPPRPLPPPLQRLPPRRPPGLRPRLRLTWVRRRRRCLRRRAPLRAAARTAWAGWRWTASVWATSGRCGSCKLTVRGLLKGGQAGGLAPVYGVSDLGSRAVQAFGMWLSTPTL